MSDAEFRSQFRFNPALRGYLAVERERFTVSDATGAIVPWAHVFLANAFRLPYGRRRWTNEFSACQVEDHSPAPRKNLEELRRCLEEADEEVSVLCARAPVPMSLVAQEVAPEDMPLITFPFDTRYEDWEQNMTLKRLKAAHRVAGTHLHIGCGSLEEAIDVANALRPHINDLVTLGDHSQGERRRLYHVVVPRPNPPHYEDIAHFREVLRQEGCERNPKDHWFWVRISTHGTVEVRAFGVTAHIPEILSWVEHVQDLIR